MSRATTQTTLLLVGALAASLACGSNAGDERGASDGSEATSRRGVVPETAVARPDGPGGSPNSRQAGDSVGASRGDDGPGAQSSETTRLEVAGVTVTVEVADDPEERHRGLMGRDSLPEDHGMLFVYSEERRLSFWMRNTSIPLDIAFLDRNGYIVDIQHMDPHTEELHESRRPATYALEMRKGWFEEHGIEEGTRVRF